MRKFTIEVEMEDRWVNEFCTFLKDMQYLGDIGSSRHLAFMADGDGDFRPKFVINTEFESIPIDKRIPFRMMSQKEYDMRDNSGCPSAYFVEGVYDAG